MILIFPICLYQTMIGVDNKIISAKQFNPSTSCDQAPSFLGITSVNAPVFVRVKTKRFKEMQSLRKTV